jgi:membrane peptidoglycan carboxypeptidase
MRKWKPVAFALLPVVALMAYTAVIVHSGQSRTDLLIDHASEIGQTGIKPGDLPQGWLDELLRVEDPGFYEHNGIDLTSPGAGITTLTQGLVKIHYFDDFKPGLAKFRQTVLALVLDSKMSKKSQLVLVLNTGQLGYVDGEEVSGFAQASEKYFGKPFTAINHDEYLSLVAMLIGPVNYNIASNPKANAERVSRIEKMLAGECAPTGLTDVYYSECG